MKAGWHKVDGVSGKIINDIQIKDDGSELRIRFAWGDDLVFKPLKEEEVSL